MGTVVINSYLDITHKSLLDFIPRRLVHSMILNLDHNLNSNINHQHPHINLKDLIAANHITTTKVSSITTC